MATLLDGSSVHVCLEASPDFKRLIVDLAVTCPRIYVCFSFDFPGHECVSLRVFPIVWQHFHVPCLTQQPRLELLMAAIVLLHLKHV